MNVFALVTIEKLPPSNILNTPLCPAVAHFASMNPGFSSKKLQCAFLKFSAPLAFFSFRRPCFSYSLVV